MPIKSATTSHALLAVAASLVEPYVAPNVVPISNVSHAQLVAYFYVLVKIYSKYEEIDLNYKDLKIKFEV